jgi:hypothetical protein
MRDARCLFQVAPRDGSDAAPRIVPESWNVNLTSKAKSDDADVERSRHARKSFAILFPQIPDVDHRLVRFDRGVELMRRGNDEQVTVCEDFFKRPQALVGLDVRVGA